MSDFVLIRSHRRPHFCQELWYRLPLSPRCNRQKTSLEATSSRRCRRRNRRRSLWCLGSWGCSVPWRRHQAWCDAVLHSTWASVSWPSIFYSQGAFLVQSDRSPPSVETKSTSYRFRLPLVGMIASFKIFSSQLALVELTWRFDLCLCKRGPISRLIKLLHSPVPK